MHTASRVDKAPDARVRVDRVRKAARRVGPLQVGHVAGGEDIRRQHKMSTRHASPQEHDSRILDSERSLHCAALQRTGLLHVGHVAGCAEAVRFVAVRVARMRVYLRQADQG